MTHLSPLPLRKALAGLAIAAALIGAPAAAIADDVVDAARAGGVIGEQADGYLGVAAGQTASADLRARVDQINIRRRAAYTERAAATGVSVNEMAAAVACQLLATRVQVGERYRDEAGTWRQRTASAPVAVPSFCGQ
ncbi:MAG: YdbL family protein [Hyphomonadaceae bacterium]|nr:YdbL family protein [Hyphomonadaceae bacterium]